MQVITERISHPDASLRLLHVTADGFRGPRHRHGQLELTWIERGSGLRFLGDSVAPFAPGDLVLVGPNVPHSWLSPATGDCASAVATVLQFPHRLFEIAELPELLRAHPLVEQSQRGLLVGGVVRPLIIDVLRSLADAGPFDRLAGLVRIVGLLRAHPGDLSPIAAGRLRGSHRLEGQAKLDRVTDWVSRRIDRAVSVTEVARVARVTPQAFSRFFRRESGKAFSVYVNDVRCGDACLKLLQTAKPVAQIARECGFRSLANFNRQFRQRTGMTPREYRRQR